MYLHSKLQVLIFFFFFGLSNGGDIETLARISEHTIQISYSKSGHVKRRQPWFVLQKFWPLALLGRHAVDSMPRRVGYGSRLAIA